MNGLVPLCLQPDGCSVVCAMDCACAHAENNITCLTQPFFSLFFLFLVPHRRVHTRSTQTHTHSLSQADMCSAQPVITAALMWSLGGTEASYYCRFMTTFTLGLLPALPPFFPFPLSFSPSCARWSCAHSPPPTPLSTPSLRLPFVQTHIHLSSRRYGTAAVCLQCAKPSCHISGAKTGFRRVFREAGRDTVDVCGGLNLGHCRRRRCYKFQA